MKRIFLTIITIISFLMTGYYVGSNFMCYWMFGYYEGKNTIFSIVLFVLSGFLLNKLLTKKN